MASDRLPSVPPAVSRLIAEIESGARLAVYLVVGDAVLAEPAATALAETLALAGGCALTTHRRPPRLASLLGDLRTFSMFEGSKVMLVIDTALVADRSSAADLVDEAAEGATDAGSGTLSPRERDAAGRLLQALRLFGVDSAGEPAQVLERLPDWAYQGGQAERGKRRGRGRGKKQIDDVRAALAALLARAREEGLEGWAEGDVADLGDAIDRGLPPGHALVLAESRWANDHPLVTRVRERGGLVEVGGLELDRQGAPVGLEQVAAELERETGVAIRADALRELARRTLKKAGGGRGQEGIDPDSTARLAAEYRKLAGISSGAVITAETVQQTVEDRGQEDVWAFLDDLAQGRVGGALGRLRRIQLAAEDAVSSRLGTFALLADYCRQLVAVGGLLGRTGVPGGERDYRRFKERLAPALQRPLGDGVENPIAKLHPYRLHRVYLAASRMPATALGRLPALVLETEARLKGESGEPDAALVALAVTVGVAAGHRRASRR